MPDDLLSKYRNGDKSAGAALLREYEPLCQRMARGYHCRWADDDDLVQEARMAVMKAIDPCASTPFDPARGNLTLWLKGAIASSLRRYVQREYRRKKCVEYLDDVIGVSDGLTLHDVLESPNATGEAAHRFSEYERVLAHLKSLTSEQRNVMRLRYVDGLTLEATGKAIGRTRQDAAYRESLAIEKIRRIMGITPT